MIDAINICLPSNNYISIEMCITDPSVRLVFRCTFSCFVIWKNQWSVLFCLLLIFQVYFLFQLYWGIINIGDLFETFTQHKKNDLVTDLFQELKMSPPNTRILPALASWPHLFPHLGAHCSQDLLLLASPTLPAPQSLLCGSRGAFLGRPMVREEQQTLSRRGTESNGYHREAPHEPRNEGVERHLRVKWWNL